MPLRPCSEAVDGKGLQSGRRPKKHVCPSHLALLKNSLPSILASVEGVGATLPDACGCVGDGLNRPGLPALPVELA